MKFPLPVRRILSISPQADRACVIVIEKNTFSSNWHIADRFESPVAALPSVLRQKRLSTDELTVSIPSTELVRPLTLPLASAGKLGQMARFEVQGLFPKNVDVACAYAILSVHDQEIHAIVAAVEKTKLSMNLPFPPGLSLPDVLLSDGLSVYQLLRAEEALFARTLVIYAGSSIAALMFTEDEDLRFLRSYTVSELSDPASEFSKVIDHIQKKYAVQGIDRLLWVGDKPPYFEDLAGRVPNAKSIHYSHPDMPSPAFYPAMGVALSLLPPGLGLNFVSPEQRSIRQKEKTKKSRLAVVALPAILLLLSANAVHLMYKLKSNETGRVIAQTQTEISVMEKEVEAARAVYTANQTMISMVHESDLALGGNAGWSKILADVSRLVPPEVTLDKISTPLTASTQPAGSSNAKRAYHRMSRPPSDLAPAAQAPVPPPPPAPKISIEGYSFDYDSIHRFFENLEAASLFQNIRPNFEILGSKQDDLFAPSDGKIHFSVSFSVDHPAQLTMKEES